MAGAPIIEPFPISYVANRYLLFDIDIISHVRREHNICGVLIGSIPHISTQNVFLGIPLELMPEEARRLVELGHAYIVDDAEAHKTGFLDMNREDRLEFLQMMDKKGTETALNAKKRSEEKSEKALQQKGLAHVAQKNNMRRASEASESAVQQASIDSHENDSLFDTKPASLTPVHRKGQNIEPYYITPPTSHPPLPTPLKPPNLSLPKVPRTYPLFSFLHSRGYFMTPGLRFGCNYSVYPGDPLRYHSHFLATGLDWNEEFDLLDIIGGGRLGTGVKKAYLIGGAEPKGKASEHRGKDSASSDGVRAFSIEWAVF